MRVVVAVTGASGVQYAYRLLQELPDDSELIVSEDAEKVIEVEAEWTVEDMRSLARACYANDNFDAPVASGSHLFDAMVIVPCSMNTVAKIANGLADNLITRAAAIALKERRKLILVPREAPLSTLHLEHLTRLSKLGAVILPAMPGFYHSPKRVEDLVDFVVARILDQLGIQHSLVTRWGEEARKAFTRPG